MRTSVRNDCQELGRSCLIRCSILAIVNGLALPACLSQLYCIDPRQLIVGFAQRRWDSSSLMDCSSDSDCGHGVCEHSVCDCNIDYALPNCTLNLGRWTALTQVSCEKSRKHGAHALLCAALAVSAQFVLLPRRFHLSEVKPHRSRDL